MAEVRDKTRKIQPENVHVGGAVDRREGSQMFPPALPGIHHAGQLSSEWATKQEARTPLIPPPMLWNLDSTDSLVLQPSFSQGQCHVTQRSVPTRQSLIPFDLDQVRVEERQIFSGSAPMSSPCTIPCPPGLQGATYRIRSPCSSLHQFPSLRVPQPLMLRSCL